MTLRSLPVPGDYSLEAVAGSHGWLRLAPFSREDGAVRAVLPGGSGLVALRVSQAGTGAPLEVVLEGGRSLPLQAEERLRRILAVDRDLSGFHRRVRRRKSLRWIADRGLGRVVRAGDFFEDLAKLILTTNCTWTQTVAMCGRLVEALGPRDGGLRGFPAPEAFLEAGETGLKALGTGYRARALLELAEGAPDLGAWEDLPPDPLRARLLELRGVGSYVADHMLMMLGHGSRVPVDSWLRERASRLLFGGSAASPARIQAHYRGLGPWAGLAAWFDLNREHFQGSVPQVG